MQVYYFYWHHKDSYVFVSLDRSTEHQLLFSWVDCLREDVVKDTDVWQKQISTLCDLRINEFHLRDILNIEHPCTFDTMDDYDFLIFRKLLTQGDRIEKSVDSPERNGTLSGPASTPMSFVITPNVLITIREQGNRAIENFVQRLNVMVGKSLDVSNGVRKLPLSPVDLSLRLLNTMIDVYLDLRAPLTRRVEFWQQQLLQGNRRFKQWHQLFHENMAFQQIENLCEEQIEMLQEFRDEIVDNYHHVVSDTHHGSQDILLVRLNDLVSHVERIQKHVLRLSNSIGSAIDLHFSAIANQTNENMRILAIITAVFAPLTLLTGIYGMNFEFIPGLKSPIGFWIMLGCMLLSTMVLLYYFYRQHLVGRGERSVIELLAQQNRNRHINFFWFLDYEPIKQTLKEVEKITKLK